MSDLVKGFGDRMRVSVSSVGGDAYEGWDSQHYRGISGRISSDLVDGDLVIAPHVGFRYERVNAERRQQFTLSVEGERQGWGAPEGNTSTYTAVVERTKADRVTPSVGLGIGWMPQVDEMAMGLQAVFDVGKGLYDDYEIERFPNERVKIDSKDAKGLSLRAGVEYLNEVYFWGEKNPGIGVVVGLYWARSLNPISDKGQGGLEGDIGLLFSF